MSNEPLPLAARLAIFLAMEGTILWHLVVGLTKRRFAFFDTPERIDRRKNAIRYWSWVCFLVLAMVAVGWRGWASLGGELAIVAACAHDRGYCP